VELIRRSGEGLPRHHQRHPGFLPDRGGKIELDDTSFDQSGIVEEVAELLRRLPSRRGFELSSFVEPEVPSVLRGTPAGPARSWSTWWERREVHGTRRGVRSGVLEAREGETVTVRLSVRDTGIGIPPETGKRSSIVHQADAPPPGSSAHRARADHLAQLVNLMGGEIQVTSENRAMGSEFVFIVPFRRGAESGPSPAGPRADLAGSAVLVVDDNATNREIVEKQLYAWGMKCRGAGGGRRALRSSGMRQAKGPPSNWRS